MAQARDASEQLMKEFAACCQALQPLGDETRLSRPASSHSAGMAP